MQAGDRTGTHAQLDMRVRWAGMQVELHMYAGPPLTQVEPQVCASLPLTQVELRVHASPPLVQVELHAYTRAGPPLAQPGSPLHPPTHLGHQAAMVGDHCFKALCNCCVNFVVIITSF